MEDTELLSPKKMEQYSGKRLLLMEKGLGSIAILIMMARLSLSDTLLARMGSGS